MALGEDGRDSETAEVDQCWSVVAGISKWCSAVGARVEKGRQGRQGSATSVLQGLHNVVPLARRLRTAKVNPDVVRA